MDLDDLLLANAERRAAAYTEAERSEVQAHARAADVRVKAARELTAPAQMAVVASLFYDAVESRLLAAAVGRDAAIATKLREDNLKDVPARTELDALDQNALEQAIEKLRAAERRLRAESEPRSIVYIRGARYGRIGAVMIAVSFLIAQSIVHAFAAPNIAFHRAVVVTGLVGTVAPAALVDGVRDEIKPVHVIGQPPSADIDLGGIYALDSIRITNRQDAHLDSNLPLTIMLAERPNEWHELVIHRVHFRTVTIPCDKARARFVRVAGSYHELALNEIEVFGRFAGP